MDSRDFRFLLLVLGEENAGLYYFNSSSLSRLRSIEADKFLKGAANPALDDRQKALQYIFCHKVDDVLSPLLKEYPVPLFVTGSAATLTPFDRWIKHVKYRVLPAISDGLS